MGKIKKVATGEKPIVVIPIIIEVVQVQVAIIRIVSLFFSKSGATLLESLLAKILRFS